MTGTITYILSRAGYRAMNGPLADERRRLAGAEPPAAYVSYDPRMLAGAGWYGYRIAFKGGDRDMVRRALAMLAEYYIIRDGYEYYDGGVYVVGVLLRERVPHYGVGGVAVSHEDDWYGVRKDREVANTALTRIGSPVLHRTLPIQSKMRRCLVLDDGTVNYYLDANDSTLKEDGTPAVLDGTDGQVMVEIPEHYVKYYTETDSVSSHVIEYRLISEFNLAGFTKVNKCYYSAFEAALDRTNSKLSSVVNTTAQYRGGANDSDLDGTYRSQIGMPVTNLSLSSFRTYAGNRGAGWTCHDQGIYDTVCNLYIIEYACTNIQAAFTSALDANGYHQGGIGLGVSSMPNWAGYNNYRPVIPCGVTVTLGNATGVVTHNVTDSAGTTVYAAPVPSYRGIENFFGHLWKHTDGILVNIAASGTSDVYRCYDITKYSNTITSDYTKVGEEARSNGYTKNVIFPTLIASQVGGDSATNWCDYHYTNIPSSGSAVRCVLWGGNAYNGAADGFAFTSSASAPSLASTLISSRLCFHPSQT